jgi:hypothetical protein
MCYIKRMSHACYFCDVTFGGGWVRLGYRLPADKPATAQNLPAEGQSSALCGRHLEILLKAGDRGRVHAATGIRWWIVDDRPGRRAP